MSMAIAWAARAAGPFGLAVWRQPTNGRIEDDDEQRDDSQPTEES